MIFANSRVLRVVTPPSTEQNLYTSHGRLPDMKKHVSIQIFNVVSPLPSGSKKKYVI